MLRVSAMTTETEIDLQGINGDAASAAVSIDCGTELMAFAEAITYRETRQLIDSRQALLDAGGAAVLVDAAGVAANFQRMVQIADSIGIPVDDMEMEVGQEVRATLDLTRFASAQNTLNPA